MEKANKEGVGREGGRWKDEHVGQMEGREWLRAWSWNKFRADPWGALSPAGPQGCSEDVSV